MYPALLLVVYLSIVSSKSLENASSVNKSELIPCPSATECEAKEKTITGVDILIQLIKKGKEGNPSSVLPRDCEDVLLSGQNKSGVHRIWPKSVKCPLDVYPLDVYCDMDTDGGGWTVIQRRGDFFRPQDYFNQGWQAYKKGFGNIFRDFWLGNDNIFALSNQKLCSIRFDLQDVEGDRRYAVYNSFWIGDEEDRYALYVDGYSGNAGDSLSLHNKQKFATKDKETKNNRDWNCAELYRGGWWYKYNFSYCHLSSLNGLYLKGKHNSPGDGVYWHHWKGSKESLEATEIKIRSKDFKKP